uniref:Uncharacterized protein n=1 Tax=Romanomermis culicivorax TaxID=13658 RepID=A0A915HPU1_ROMCU
MLKHTNHMKLLTAPKAPKKKKKKQKEEWNKSPDISDDEDPSLQPMKIYDNPKRLQAAVVSAMKSGLMHRLIELLGFPLSPIYKLAIRNYCLNFLNDTPLSKDIDDIWIEGVAADQPLCDCTYNDTHYHCLPNTILSLLQVDGGWFQQLTTTMLLAAVLASPCSATEFAYVNDLLAKQAQTLDNTTRTVFYSCMKYRTEGNPPTCLTDWKNHIPQKSPPLTTTLALMFVILWPCARSSSMKIFICKPLSKKSKLMKPTTQPTCTAGFISILICSALSISKTDSPFPPPSRHTRCRLGPRRLH